MKKASFILVFLSLITLSAQAQWFDFSNNRRFTLGLNLGSVGYHLDLKNGLEHQDYANFGVGISVQAGGVYLDFMRQTPEHKFSRQVGVPNWLDEYSALTINAGYQLPVLEWLYVMPLVGFSYESMGITYANQVEVGDHQLIHNYEPYQDRQFYHFNYGLGVSVRVIDLFEIGAVASSHAIYGNISFCFK